LDGGFRESKAREKDTRGIKKWKCWSVGMMEQGVGSPPQLALDFFSLLQIFLFGPAMVAPLSLIIYFPLSDHVDVYFQLENI